MNHERCAWLRGMRPRCMSHCGWGPLVTHLALWHEKHSTSNTCSVLFTTVHSVTRVVTVTNWNTYKRKKNKTLLPFLVIFAHYWRKKRMRKLQRLNGLSCSLSHESLCSVLPPTATHSSSHPRNITWHASQGRSMILALFIPSVLAIRLLPFPISPLGPLSVTYIRSFHFQRDDRAIKWTANDRQSGTSPLAVSPLGECGRQLNQTCYLLCKADKNNTRQSIRTYIYRCPTSS